MPKLPPRPETTDKRYHALCCIAFLLIAAWVAFLVHGWQSHAFIRDAQGHIIDNDFVNVWAAGALVNAGAPADAYDWTLHREVEVEALGHDFTGYYGWHYPPTFLLVAGILALMPYLTAWLVWSVVSFMAYAAVLQRVFGHGFGILFSAAFPAAMWNAALGQNGFLTAALLGGALHWMERRPVLAGIMLGLLAYKPQYGLLFPLVLLFERRWRMIFAASATVLVAGLLSLWRYGLASWEAFFHWMPVTAQAVFEQGSAGFGKLQSVAGVVRLLGGSVDAANFAQVLFVGVLLLWVVRLRRHAGVSGNVKAAALGLASVLATPYVYIYDLVALAIPLAFLMREIQERGRLNYEALTCVFVVFLVFLFPFVETAPLGLLAMLITGVALQRRVSAKMPV